MKKGLLLLNATGGFDATVLEAADDHGVYWEDIVAGSGSALDALGVKGAPREALLELVSSGWCDREVDRCEKKGIQIIFFGEACYPSMLNDLRDPPLVLYARGKGLPSGDAVAVVGTRKCTSYGSSCAYDLASMLAGAGVTVVSGGAMGIDGAAHRGSIDSGGRTVAVIGTGADIFYPAQHASLFG
ncbi:MAG TPA: DNA-processing protein DprA, partial [Synergistales bacterium]|nr:DNA-processing protein DprA [Synergistales bacterium]